MQLLLTFFAAVIAGFFLLVWGADRFVLGAAATARNLGVSPLLIGLTIVGFGTSAPEVLISAMASLQNTPGLAIGNALGSNVANIALVLGATAIVTPLDVRSETVRQEIPILLAVTLLSLLLFLDGRLSLFDGAALLGGLVILMFWIIRLGFKSAASDPMYAEYDAEIRSDLTNAMAVAWLALGFAVLLLGSHLLVWGSQHIASALGVSDTVIGVTIVAVGTSLPELAVCIAGARKNEHDLVLGNIIGSNMFNLLAVIGVAAVIRPFAFEPSILEFHFPVMVGLTLVLFAMAYNFSGGGGRINRLEGGALLITFGVYHSFIFAQNLS